jgi:small subunit ribosomal protein S24e
MPPLRQTASLNGLVLLSCCVVPVLLPVRRLIRQGLAKKVDRSRKQLKEKKNRLRKVRGIKKAKN